MDIIKSESLYSLKIYLTKYSATKIVLIKSIGVGIVIYGTRLRQAKRSEAKGP